jgi:5-methylcytosine-specific restriction endonuclease McrA
MPEWKVWDRLKEYECKHENVTPTKAQKSNGVICVYLQCAECGEKTKEDRKSDHNVDRLPWFDEGFRERQRKRNAIIREKLHQQWEAERQAELSNQDAAWWAGYNGYLQSSHWQQLRRSVIYRDQFRCQNCFQKVTDASAHVHHLSYVGFNRVGQSFAFECVTLCRDCHSKFHAKDIAPVQPEPFVVPF